MVRNEVPCPVMGGFCGKKGEGYCYYVEGAKSQLSQGGYQDQQLTIPGGKIWSRPNAEDYISHTKTQLSVTTAPTLLWHKNSTKYLPIKS